MNEATAQATQTPREAEHLAPLLRLDTAVESVEFNFTNRCNLRCVYCPQGSHPEGFHAETSRRQLDEIVAYIESNGVEKASIGYYGETTLVSGWEEVCQRLLDLGVRMTIVSNFSRALSAREIEVLAQFEEIQVSIDSVDQKILRAVRKSVDVRSILYGCQLVQAQAILKRIPVPKMIWTGVLTNEVVMGLSQLVATAASCSIRHVNFNSVGYFEGAQGAAMHVCDMPEAEFLRAAEEIERALALAAEREICLVIQDHGRIMRRLVEITGKTRVLDNGHYLANLDDLSPQDRIFVYGSGAPGRYIARQIAERKHLNFQAFIDSRWSGEVDARPVMQLDAYLRERQGDDLILVCSQAYDQIEVQLREAEVDRYLDAREIYLHCAGRSGASGEERIVRKGIQGNFEVVGDAGDDLPRGLTRLCDSPWSQIYSDPRGEVYSCCQRGEVMGKLDEGVGLADVLNAEPYRRLRRQLLTGNDLSPECSRCVIRSAATPEKLQSFIAAKVASRS